MFRKIVSNYQAAQSLWVLYIGLLLVIFFQWPLIGSYSILEEGKHVVYTAAGGLLLIWLSAGLFWCKGVVHKFSLSLLLTSGFLLLTQTLSALLSGHWQHSIFGLYGEMGTVLSIVVFLVVLNLSATIHSELTSRHLTYGFWVLILGLVQLLAIMALIVSPSWYVTGNTLVGSITTLVSLSGLTLLIAAIHLENSRVSQGERLFGLLAILTSVGLLVYSNISLVLVVAAVFLGLFVLVRLWFRFSNIVIGWPTFAILALLVLAVGYGLVTPKYDGPLSLHDRITVSRDFGDYVDFVGEAVTAAPEKILFGYGPNLFDRSWHQIRWSVYYLDSESALGYLIGFLPTQTFQTGLLGILGWLVLLTSILLTLVRRRQSDSDWRLPLAIFLYTLLVLTFLTPGPAFFYGSALLLGSIYSKRDNSWSDFNSASLKVRRLLSLSFGFAGLVLIVLATKQFLAYNSYLFALDQNKQSNYIVSEKYVKEAAAMYSHQLYLQTLSQLHLNQARLAFTTGEKDRLSVLIQQALHFNEIARSKTSVDYRSWVTCGDIYFLLLGVAGAENTYRLGNNCYTEALQLSPGNYLILFKIALMNYNVGNFESALRTLNLILESYQIDYRPALELKGRVELELNKE